MLRTGWALMDPRQKRLVQVEHRAHYYYWSISGQTAYPRLQYPLRKPQHNTGCVLAVAAGSG